MAEIEQYSQEDDSLILSSLAKPGVSPGGKILGGTLTASFFGAIRTFGCRCIGIQSQQAMGG